MKQNNIVCVKSIVSKFGYKFTSQAASVSLRFYKILLNRIHCLCLVSGPKSFSIYLTIQLNFEMTPNAFASDELMALYKKKKKRFQLAN